ncbi:CD3337/EF1877 family mobilome membrane protein [Listeria monocytogenes]
MQTIKKNKWIFVTVLLCAVIFFIFPIQQILADDAQSTVNAKSVKKGGIELLSEKYDMSHYEALTSTDGEGMIDSTIIEGMNSIANFFFSITKLIGEVIDTGIGYLYSLDAIKLLSDKVGNISEMLWDNLYQTFGILFFLVAVLQIFFTVVVKKNGVAAGKKAFMLFLVIGISFVWFTNSSWYIKSINSLSSETQGVIMKAGTAFSADSGQKITKGEELDGSLAVMRNAYFSIVVEKPYLLMNYGTPDKAEILKNNPDRIDNMLKYKMTKEGMKSKKELIDSEVNDLGNNHMSAGNVAQKMGVAFLSMIFSIILGCPLLLIAFLNLLLQVLALGVSLILPVSFIMSFIPSFSSSGWKTFGKLVGIFLLKALVGMIILFVFLIITIIDTLIPATNIGMYFLNGIVIAVCIILLIMFRDKLISLISGGMVASLDNHITDDTAGFLKNKLRGSNWFKNDYGNDPEDEDEDEDEPENESRDNYDNESESEERTTQEILEEHQNEADAIDTDIDRMDDGLDRGTHDNVTQSESGEENDSNIDLPDSISEDEEKIDPKDSELEEPISTRTDEYTFARDNRVPQTLSNEPDTLRNQNDNIRDFEEKPLNSTETPELDERDRTTQEIAEESQNEASERMVIHDWDARNEERLNEENGND